jgi:hypothetical protein
VKKLQREEFIQKLKPHAQEIHRNHQILTSLVIAQAGLESNFGTNELARNANNLFSIKGSYDGQSYSLNVNEFYNGKEVWEVHEFRLYPSWEASIDDYKNLILYGRNWNPNLYTSVIGIEDWKEACHAIGRTPYATDPLYAEKLIGVIERYELYKFDKEVFDYAIGTPIEEDPFPVETEENKSQLEADNFLYNPTPNINEIEEEMDYLNEVDDFENEGNVYVELEEQRKEEKNKKKEDLPQKITKGLSKMMNNVNNAIKRIFR